jgi:hypothetical protein
MSTPQRVRSSNAGRPGPPSAERIWAWVRLAQWPLATPRVPDPGSQCGIGSRCQRVMRLRQRGHTPRYWALNRALQTHTALAQTARRSLDSLPHLHVSTTQPDQFSKDILRTAEHWCAIPRLNHRQFREDMQALGLLFCRVCGGVDDGVGAADRCRLSRAAWRGGGVIGDLSSGSPTCRPDARRAMLPDRLVRLRESVSANSFQPHHSS